MSFTALSRTLLCATLVFAGTAVLAKDAPILLSCETEKVERTALEEAPRGAHRVGEHVLEVTSQKGRQKFVDKPPHDEGGMGGIHWRYCGYDSRAKAHLIRKSDKGLFSGALLLDETGKRLRAGHTALFSPDAKEFLAIEQEDGVDGENWAVYDTTGKLQWKGYAGTIAKINGIETVVSTFEHPQWTRQGVLTAQYLCASTKVRGIVTLVREPSGAWRWHGHRKCS
ncbi:hypothetical protein ACFQ09_10245 [Massilia norwichensis]|uniref:Uncharacterized protein n=1 Tax=Massilia norwichensis TaxID=1442366 RepID=A0ABT2A5L2_9BURK|nr:hypothetical protein [Massilia norwichensis]MCS0589486.1 hypothetical protein [Massilia norwichensis]